MCLAAASLSLNARAQDERQYSEGPVTEVDEVHVEYGRFEEYIDWLNSTWKPTMEALKKAGLIIDYKVFSPSGGEEPWPSTPVMDIAASGSSWSAVVNASPRNAPPQRNQSHSGKVP